MSRIDLRDGQWAELRSHITHGQDKAIRRRIVAGNSDPAQAFDLETEVVRAFVADWYVKDDVGAAIVLSDTDAVERAPSDVIDDLFNAITPLYLGASRPNPLTPPSSDD